MKMMLMSSCILLLVLSYYVSSYQLLMSLDGKTQFLRDKDQSVYINTILRRSVEATKEALKDNENRLLEIEFVPNRKNDLSVTETLDTTRDFALQYVNAIGKQYGSDLWVLFPDSKELQLARKVWGDNTFFTMTSIEGAIKAREKEPKLLVALSPGFNVEEWIELAKWNLEKAPLIVINGNLDRLRQGYYPSFFYPGLARVTNSFYTKAIQVFFLQPVSIVGDRFGGFTARCYPGQWETLIKSATNYEVIKSSSTQTSAKTVFEILSKAYKEKYNKLF